MASEEMLSTFPCSNPYLSEIKSIDFDFDFVTCMNETNIAVTYHRFDLELAVTWHDDREGLRGRHDPADGVYGQLLDHARDRRGQLLKFGALLCF